MPDNTSKTLNIKDFASKIGVSRSLVSMAFTGNGRIAPQTRDRVLQAAKEMGYEPNPYAQQLVRGRGIDTVAVFCRDLDTGIGTRKINLIQQELMERGYKVPIHACGFFGGSDVQLQCDLMRDLRRQKPRAIVCSTMGLHPQALEELRAFGEEGGLVVCYDHPIDLECDRVLFDRTDNTYQAARHLLELGHREIGFYMHGPQEPGEGERGTGFRRALGEFGVQHHAEWMFSGGLYEEGGAHMVERFLKLKEKPSALCILNDQAALGFVLQAARHGLEVPRDLSLVGHDDAPVARLCPVPLSTVTHPIEAIVENVVELLASRMEGRYDGPPRQITVRGELVRRDSAISITV